MAQLQPQLRGPERTTALAVLDRRSPDLIAALDRAIDAGDRTSALSLATGLGWWWLYRRRSEGATKLVAALACAGEAAPLLEADARRWTAFVGDFAGQGILTWSEIEALAEAARAGYEQLGHALGSGLTSLVLASCARHTGRRDQARAHAAEAVEVFDRRGDGWRLATATIIGVDLDLDDPEHPDDDRSQLERIDRAGELFTALDDGWGLVHTSSRRAEWFERQGQTRRAAAERRTAKDRADVLGLDLAQA